MRLRTFTAPDMPSAMRQVREALGGNAIILSSETHKGKKGVSVTAAVDQEDDDELRVTGYEKKETPLATRNLQPATEHLRFQIQETLRFHNIPELFIAKIMNADRSAWILDKRGCLEKLLTAYFTFEPLVFSSPLEGEGGAKRRERGYLNEDAFSKMPPLPNPPPQGGRENCIMLVGPPGIGKTLTIARMAAKLTMDGQQVLIITTDNKRAGGVEQLQAFTTILDQPLQVADSRKALAGHLKSARKNEHVLIDTAGCNPYDQAELGELADFAGQKGIEPVLALPAGGDSLEAIDTVEAFMALPIKRMLVTRADTTRRFGGVIAAAAAHGLAFCNASNSSSITDPLLPVDEALLAQLLLRYQNG